VAQRARIAHRLRQDLMGDVEAASLGQAGAQPGAALRPKTGSQGLAWALSRSKRVCRIGGSGQEMTSARGKLLGQWAAFAAVACQNRVSAWCDSASTHLKAE
jgi:hypothetical protein